MYDGDESEGPKGTFEIYKAEADSLFKQGEYKKSIDSYTIVSYTLSLFHYVLDICSVLITCLTCYENVFKRKTYTLSKLNDV